MAKTSNQTNNQEDQKCFNQKQEPYSWSFPGYFHEVFTVNKISDQNPTMTRTAAHYTVLGGFQPEGFRSLFFLDGKIRISKNIQKI